MVGEIVIGIANTAVIDPGRSAVPGVGTALHAQQDRSSAFDAKLRGGCLLHAQFLNGVRRKCNRRNTENSSLIDGRVAVVTVVVVQAIDEIVVGRGSGAVAADGQEPAAR